MEYQHRLEGDYWGTRVNIQKAFNPNNRLLAEVPFLYNVNTGNFGLADIRVRYFSVFRRNLSKKFIALGAFADITAPTGKYDNGFGGSSWSLAAGVITGFAFSKNFAFFPGVSYIHLTKPTKDLIDDDWAKRYSQHKPG
jgi:hypothetical protein